MQTYNQFNNFLKNKFGERVLKICIDGGFTCPNRDERCGRGGCIFCGERGGSRALSKNSIALQVKNHLNSYRGERANKFIVYFQNFTNTYDTIENLRRKYDSSLISSKIVALAIATRPDCIDKAVCDLIANYKKKGLYVWVELGLQTVNENVGKTINRGYTNADFDNALKILRSCEIDVVAHLMVGLPGQGKNDVRDAVNFINQRDVQGIKIHSTYITKGTKLADMYNQGTYLPLEYENYIDAVVFILTHLRSDIVVHRITGDPPKDILIAPEWASHKKKVINGINKKMAENDLFQGCFYKTT